MDNVTHSLFGATLGRALFPRGGRGTTAALVIASNAPDADIIMTAGGPLNYLTWHRGPTHGPLGVILLALVTGVLVRVWQRRFDTARSAEHASYATLVLAAFAGLLAHVLMDFPTSYGTRLLSPFNWTWFATDLMPIVDIYLLIALGGLMWLGSRQPLRRQQAAQVAIIFALANYGLRAVAHQSALAAAPQVMAPLLPERCADAIPPSLLSHWPVDNSVLERRQRGVSRCVIEVAAVPTFFSPFRWQVIARLSDAYVTMPLNLMSDRQRSVDALDAPWREATHHADQWTPAAVAAARSDLGRVFLGFSRFPATRSQLNDDGSSTVQWNDLRFASVPGRRPGAPRGMFSARVTLAPDGSVQRSDLGE